MPEVLEHRLLEGRLLLQLLPAAAYSARDPVQWQTLGVTLERQRGCMPSIPTGARISTPGPGPWP